MVESALLTFDMRFFVDDLTLNGSSAELAAQSGSSNLLLVPQWLLDLDGIGPTLAHVFKSLEVKPLAGGEVEAQFPEVINLRLPSGKPDSMDDRETSDLQVPVRGKVLKARGVHKVYRYL